MKLNPLNLIERLLYPSFCKSCSSLIKQDSIFCDNCYSKIEPLVSYYLPLTKTRKVKVFAAGAYKDFLRKMILEKSYSKNILVFKQLAEIIYKKTNIKNLDIDYLVPVPLHWSRFARRGYNQAFVIAKELSKNLNVPVLDILERNKKTKFQSMFSFKDRQKNVKNIFSIKSKYEKELRDLLNNKNIVLVDDLCTTGATLKNSGKALLKLNPKSINAAVVCRVI